VPETDTPEAIVRTTRDDAVLRAKLENWLSERLPPGASPTVSEISSPSGSGMSSETLLFDASWTGADGTREAGAYVGRMAPSAADYPTFPSYDLEMQAKVIRLAGQHGVPVPIVEWLELDPDVLGAPFFVMRRVRGRVPADMPNYVTEGFVFDASPDERRVLQDQTVAAIAQIHSVELKEADKANLEFDVPGKTPLARHLANQRAYYEWATPDKRSPLIERAFEHLEGNLPKDTSTVLSWGDSRIGNVMYGEDSFEPVAILDWEMAGLGPREIDLGWLAFMHSFFQTIFESMGATGLPDFLRAEDIAETYARITGHSVESLDWYVTYAALRHAIIMSRIAERMVHFGQAQPAEDPDDRIPHRAALESMLSGKA
jgi:aminoglycoside phosphotransferase (APT) family kinase protein